MDPTAEGACTVCRLPFGQGARDQYNRCPFCDKSFPRVDAATRHARSCRARAGRPLPAKAKRGRKARACDACFRIKVSCDAKTPCGHCSARGLPCVYGRFCQDPSHQPARPGPSHSLADSSPQRSQLKAPFLLKTTDPSVDSVNQILANEPEKDVDKHAAWENLPRTDGILDAFTIDPRLLFTGLLSKSPESPEYDLEPPEYGNAFYDRHEGCAVPACLSLDDELGARAHLLLSELSQFTSLRPHLADVSDRFLLPTFFTSANCQMFMLAFFRRRHYHSSLIHWPTLDSPRIALPLLLAILLTGAAYSHWHETKRDVGFSRRIHVLAEKYIYSRLKARIDTRAAPTNTQETLEILQAAYLINYLLIGMNDVAIRRAVMAKRHPTLVMSLRTLGMVASERNLSTELDTFIYRESCIRLVTWTFLTDALLTLFFNNPPVMTLADVSCRLPCSEEIWDKESLGDCDIQRAEEELSMGISGHLTLKGILSSLLAEEQWTATTMTSYEQLSARHLHATIFALQPIIFNYRTMLLPSTVAQVLLRALDRWKLLWDRAIDRVPADQRPWLGVARHAAEIAWLSRRILEAGVTGQGEDCIYLQRVTTYNLADFHHFIRRYGASTESRS